MANLIFDYTVPSATSSVTIDLSSTPIQKGELYELTCTFISPGDVLALFVNNNKNRNAYVRQQLYAGGTTIVGGRQTTDYGAGIAYSNNTTPVNTYIKLTNNGYIVYQSSSNRRIVTASSMEYDNYYATSTFTVTSITRLDLDSLDVANSISAGSRIQLRKVADKVAEVDVSTATTSVTFDNLTIGKDSEYLLVADRFNPTSSSSIRLFANNNQTNTNYWRQFVYAAGTTTGATRVNESSFGYSITNHRVLSIASIKLTNNGYFTVQSNYAADYTTGSEVYIGKQYMTSTFTTTEITRLDVVSQAANGLGVGSRIELYKLI